MNRRTATLLAAAAALGLAGIATAEVSENFGTYCAVCHGEDGKAQTEKGRQKRARNFTDRKWQASVDDARLVRSVTRGHDKMPKFGDKLSPEEIQALVKEVRSFAGK